MYLSSFTMVPWARATQQMNGNWAFLLWEMGWLSDGVSCVVSTPPPPHILGDWRWEPWCGAYGLWAHNIWFDPFLEWDNWPAVGASLSPDFKPTFGVVAMLLTLLEQVFIVLGTWLLVLRDLECVIVYFLLMAAPHVVGMVSPVEALTEFWLDFLEGRVGVPFLSFVDGLPITLRTKWHRKEVIAC